MTPPPVTSDNSNSDEELRSQTKVSQAADTGLFSDDEDEEKKQQNVGI